MGKERKPLWIDAPAKEALEKMRHGGQIKADAGRRMLVKLSQIAFGAVLCSIIGTLMYRVDSGIVSLFCTTLLIIWLMNRFKWIAPPILAIAFVPFFSGGVDLWAFPAAVAVSLLGLVIILFAADTVGKHAERHPQTCPRKPEAEHRQVPSVAPTRRRRRYFFFKKALRMHIICASIVCDL